MLCRVLSLLPFALLPLIAASEIPLALPTSLDSSTSKELLHLHRKLIEIESITENEKHAGKWLASYLRDRDWTVEKQQVAENRYNLLAYRSKRETSVLLTSHIDTVPPYWPYYHNETLDVIGGRGSVDAKASVAAQIIAAMGLEKEIQDDISLLFVVGEETGGDGMRAFSDWDKRPKAHDVIIFGEPTESKLVCGHKGMLGATLHATGKAAHSGYPWLGVSANDVLVEALAALLELRNHLPWSEKYGNTTMNFGRIQGGVAANVVAETASANIATRIASGTPDAIRNLVLKAVDDVKSAAKKQGGDLEVTWSSEGYGPVNIDCNIDGFETLTVNYGTDIPNLSGQHKRYLYGPGSIFVAHSDHEALKKKELEQAVFDYQTIITKAREMEGKKDRQKDYQLEL